jgi:hypothetical protein
MPPTSPGCMGEQVAMPPTSLVVLIRFHQKRQVKILCMSKITGLSTAYQAVRNPHLRRFVHEPPWLHRRACRRVPRIRSLRLRYATGGTEGSDQPQKYTGNIPIVISYRFPVLFPAPCPNLGFRGEKSTVCSCVSCAGIPFPGRFEAWNVSCYHILPISTIPLIVQTVCIGQQEHYLWYSNNQVD